LFIALPIIVIRNHTRGVRDWLSQKSVTMSDNTKKQRILTPRRHLWPCFK